MKPYVLDASALLVFVQKTAGAQKVSELFKNGVRGSIEIFMSAVNYGEVYGLILREYGLERAVATMSALQPLPLCIMDATIERTLRAADVKSKYKLYYVDSFAAALAIECQAKLVTSDSDFRRLGHSFPIAWL
ncbi:MAG: type II toxin-antitoxin system VapC family toxin [Candidatus Sulfotelmatobacter sp.]